MNTALEEREEKMKRVQLRTQAYVIQPCEDLAIVPICCGLRAVAERLRLRGDLSRHASLCMCFPPGLSHSPVRMEYPFHVNLNAYGSAPIAKCWNRCWSRAETAPIAPFSGITSPAAQHGCHANQNKPDKL